MHNARRPLRIKRTCLRASSTAANPAPRPLGKWERPQSSPAPDGRRPSGSLPSVPTKSRSWNLPSAPAVPQSRSWNVREVDVDADASTSTSRTSIWPMQSAGASSSLASSLASSEPRQGTGNWSRPQAAYRPEPSSSSRRPPAVDTFGQQRDIAPHQAPPPITDDPTGFTSMRKAAWSESSVREDTKQKQGTARSSSSLGRILDKRRINSELQKLAEEADLSAESQLREQSVAPPMSRVIIQDVEVVPSPDLDEPGVKPRLRGYKHDRREFKERGSLISRDAEAAVIPKHSRSVDSRSHDRIKEKEKEKKAAQRIKPMNVDIFIPSVISVSNLAKLLNVRYDTLRRTMIKVGMDAEASHDHMLTAEYASLLAMEFGRNPVVNDEAAFDIYPPPPHSDPSKLPHRPPVVTIMGHVDHGKTTLLDTLRSTSIAKGEAGGITQHIGAFSVPVLASGSDERTITFLDTPGHAAFSAMRARGAGVTDVVVLVVAADDGIMPQTREVIQLVQKEKVGVVVAINKVDKPGVDINKVEHALLAEGLQLETFGGDIPTVHVSGLTGQGLDQLVETISALAEMQDLRAEREGNIQGYVLESKVQKGIGSVATVLLLRGCLKPSHHVIAGMSHAKVRLLHDSNGKAVKAAYPGMAVTVSGWKELPKAGDEVLQGTENEVKKALANRIRKSEIEATLQDMEAINEQRRLEREQREREAEAEAAGVQDTNAPMEPKESGPKELKLIIKADVSGSVEAIAGALEGIGNNLVRVKVVATGVGDVTESDIMRAKAVEGLIVAFSVNITRPIQAEAASQQVPLLSSSIIYRLMDDVKERVVGLLPPIIEKHVSGEANVLQLFDIHLKGKKTAKVAGCRVTNGVVEKNKLARVVRDGEIVHEGRLDTLKHLKKDVMEVSKGTECGINLEGFDDIRVGDMIQIYQEIQKPGNL